METIEGKTTNGNCYVEYFPGKGLPTILAQETGADNWYVYVIKQGKTGCVTTLAGGLCKETATAIANTIATGYATEVFA